MSKNLVYGLDGIINKKLAAFEENIIISAMANKSDVSTPKPKDLHLPLSRVKTIMKSSPDVEAVGPEPLFLVTKVTVRKPNL